MGNLNAVKEEYWKIVSRTRTSGRIAQSVKDRIEERWKKFDDEVVVEALQIHMSRYKGYKESYTIGIMRNLQKRKDSGGQIKTGNAFTQFKQNEYDFDQLEKEILAN